MTTFQRWAATGSLAWCALTGTAQAHIIVSPRSAPMGADVAVTFRVPNERLRTNTTAVVVVLPRDEPLPVVAVDPQPGWAVRIATRHLAAPMATGHGPIRDVVDEITWSGGRIMPGASHTFTIHIGPLPPHAGPLYFKTLQRYANGEVVRWIDLPQPGEDEPANPAPVLLVTATARSAR